MKKLLVLISVSLVIIFSGCEELFDDSVSHENYARYRILIKNTDEWAKLPYLTISADPPTNYIDVELEGVAQDGGTGSYDFELPLDVYEGKTVYVKLYSGASYKEARPGDKHTKKVVVKETGKSRSVLHFKF